MTETPAPEEILDDDRLWRRIHPTQTQEDGGRRRVTSAAFTDERLSVDLARIQEHYTRTLIGYSGYGVAEIQAGFARSLGQQVIHRPLAENPAHSQIEGRKSRSVARSLAKAASDRMLVWPAEMNAG